MSSRPPISTPDVFSLDAGHSVLANDVHPNGAQPTASYGGTAMRVALSSAKTY